MSKSSQVSHRSNESLQHWLKLNRLTLDINDSVLVEHCNEIYEAFDTPLQIIRFMIKHGNKEQLSRMLKFMKKLQTDHINQQKSANNLNVKDNDSKPDSKDLKTISVFSPFSSISTSCIEIISSFLDRQAIRSFKITSSRNAIICLQEMRKCSVNVLNTNILFKLTPNAIDIRFNTVMSRYRQNQKKQYYSLFEEWQNIYQINEENQLLFTFDNKNNLKQTNVQQIRYSPINQFNPRKFFVVDKRKTVLLDSKSQRIMNENDTYNTSHNYAFLILQYFDVRHQTMNIVQFLMISPDVTYKRIIEYIQNDYIDINNESNWYYQLSAILNKMKKDPNTMKLCLIGAPDNLDKSSIYCINQGVLDGKYNNLSNVVTFGLNGKHPWCIQQLLYGGYFEYYKDESKRKFQRWYSNFIEFCMNTIPIESSYLSAISSSDYINNLNETQKAECTLKEILEKVDTIKNKITFHVDKNATCGSLKIHISNILPNINPNEIEIFSGYWTKYLSCDQKITSGSDGHIIREISFDIVPYDTSNKLALTDSFYKLRIYTLNEVPCPFPRLFLRGVKKQFYNIRIKYKKEFTVSDLLKFLISSIKSISTLKSNQYSSLLNVLTNTQFDYILKHRYSTYLSQNDEFKISSSHNELTLIIYPRKSPINKSKLLCIRFSKRNNINTKKKIWNDDGTYKANIFDGFPMIIWIDKKDTLQDVINTHLNEYKGNIFKSYAVYPETKTISCISISHRDYRLYNCSRMCIALTVAAKMFN